MKKLLIVFVCITLLLCGCQSIQTSDQNTVAPTPTATIPSVESATPTPSPAIKPIPAANVAPYYDFLMDLSAGITENFNDYSFFLKDLDNNGVRELCLYFPHSSSGTILRVYTYTTLVQEIGELHFSSGTTQLLYTDSYPGIVQFNLGGGRNWYSYITVIDGKLSSSYIWNEDYTGAAEAEGLSPIKEFTADKKLIAESGKAYKNDQYIPELSLGDLE